MSSLRCSPVDSQILRNQVTGLSYLTIFRIRCSFQAISRSHPEPLLDAEADSVTSRDEYHTRYTLLWLDFVRLDQYTDKK